MSLEIGGDVANPGSLTSARLVSLADAANALAVEGSRVLPVGDVLRVAQASDSAGHVTFVGGDGDYTASIPIADASDKGLLLVGHDEAGLAPDRGGPIRLIVRDGDTLCWNVKDVTAIRVTAAKEDDSVPNNPPH